MLLVVDNADGELMTGAFTNVSFVLPHPAVAINVPASALIFDQTGLQIATVGTDNRVVLEENHDRARSWQRVEIGSGISADDDVIESPPDGIASGDPGPRCRTLPARQWRFRAPRRTAGDRRSESSACSIGFNLFAYCLKRWT